MDGDINERLINNNNINDDGTGGALSALLFFGGRLNSQLDLVRFCILLVYISETDRQLSLCMYFFCGMHWIVYNNKFILFENKAIG